MFLSSGIHSSLINIQDYVGVVVLECQIRRCELINKNVLEWLLGRCLLYPLCISDPKQLRSVFPIRCCVVDAISVVLLRNVKFSSFASCSLYFYIFSFKVLHSIFQWRCWLVIVFHPVLSWWHSCVVNCVGNWLVG